MALFGKKKDGRKKISAAERLGLKVEKVPTQEEAVERGLHDQIILAYGYVRDRIDRGCHHYYRSGSFAKLEEFVGRPALDQMCDRLAMLRSANIYWQQPDRTSRTQPDPRVIPSGLKLDSDGRPLEFVVEERFLDFSVHKRLSEGGRFTIDGQCPGTPRAIQSKVTVRNGNEFKLVEVIEVKGATL
jgi:hypothetical protein